VTLATTLASCTDTQQPTDVVAVGPSQIIADAPRGFKAGFYWLAPMVLPPTYSGTFDAALQPSVEICQLVADACAGVLATFTTSSGPGSERVRLDATNEHYIVNWHTDQFSLAVSGVYRISVRAGSDVLLGYADVQPVSTGKELKNVETGEYIGLVDGRTLPVKFRIETNVVAEVRVTPSTATVNAGATQQFTATVTDLHGNSLNVPLTWGSSNPSVATIDGAGLVTAVTGGDAVITANAERVNGSATVSVPAGVKFTQIGTSYYNSCALSTTRNLYCWGASVVSPTAGSAVPYKMPSRSDYLTFGMGAQFTCGVKSTGQAYCSGSAPLGDGTLNNSFDPVAVVGGIIFRQIAPGFMNTCALAEDGQAYCWGTGRDGQTGNGLFGLSNLTLVPTPVQTSLRFSTITTGPGQNLHTCAITLDGAAYCWGNNVAGQLGTGLTGHSAVPVPVAGSHQFVAITAGSGTVCALTSSGQAYCWGDGTTGALGDGAAAVRRSPVPVAGNLSFQALSAGVTHSCGIATEGAAYCWGGNFYGQLGNGTTASTTSPVAVAGGHRFIAISAGPEHTCGVRTDGRAMCWGRGHTSQLGDGGGTDSAVPVLVAEPE
jgi:hypothetical protein